MKEGLTVEISPGFNLTAKYYPAKPPSTKPLLFCLPGGGVTTDFFDLAPNYSFTDRMTEMGFDVMTMNHPGTVDNPLPKDHGFLEPRQAADYIYKALSQLIPPTRSLIGLGHSMGGMTITLMQGKHNIFDAIALLGSSAGGLDWGLTDAEKTYIDNPEELARDLEKLTLNKFGSEFISYPSAGPSGRSITFGGETEALNQRLREVTCTLFATGGMMSVVRDSFIKEVEALKVPLFFAFGDHDVGIPPQEVPKAYLNAASTELLVLENTAHNHMAFSSIEMLCSKMEAWAQSLA